MYTCVYKSTDLDILSKISAQRVSGPRGNRHRCRTRIYSFSRAIVSLTVDLVEGREGGFIPGSRSHPLDESRQCQSWGLTCHKSRRCRQGRRPDPRAAALRALASRPAPVACGPKVRANHTGGAPCSRLGPRKTAACHQYMQHEVRRS